MRILHCIESMEGGGAERQLVYLCEGLVQLGHQVDVVYMLDGVHGSRMRASGARVHALGWRKQADPSLLWDLSRLIRGREIDVVQTWLRRMDLMGGAAAKLLGRPWVYSERNLPIPLDGWRETLRHRWGAHASAIIANSQAGARRWREVLGARNQVHVVPNALALDEIERAKPAPRAALGIPEGAELILFVARFQPQKNIELLGAALAALLARRPDAYALCCGEGGLLAPFRAALDAAGVGARCLTPGYRRDVWSLMKSADVLISTSRHEGHPNSVLEAIACRLPVVLSDIPEHREIVFSEDAVFFARESASEAADAVERALTDREGARARALRAAEAVGKLSVTGMARSYEGIYESLVGPVRRRS